MTESEIQVKINVKRNNDRPGNKTKGSLALA